MMDFFLCVVQYLMIAIVIAAVGGLGVFIGISLRKRRDAKEAESNAQNTEDGIEK